MDMSKKKKKKKKKKKEKKRMLWVSHFTNYTVI